MNSSNYKLSLDVQQACSSVMPEVKQGDTKRELWVTLTDGGAPYPISEECYAVFTAAKPDGTFLSNPCRIQGNTVVYALTPQTVAAAGVCDCEIKLYGADDGLLTSARFGLLVQEPAVGDGDVIQSETEVNALTQLISDATDVIRYSQKLNLESETLVEELEQHRGDFEQRAAQADTAAKEAALAAAAAEGAAQEAVRAGNAAELAGQEAEYHRQAAEGSADEAQLALQMAQQYQGLAAASAAEAKAYAEEAAQSGGSGLTPSVVGQRIEEAIREHSELDTQSHPDIRRHLDTLDQRFSDVEQDISDHLQKSYPEIQKELEDIQKQLQDKVSAPSGALDINVLNIVDYTNKNDGVSVWLNDTLTDEDGKPLAREIELGGFYSDEPVIVHNVYEPRGDMDAANKAYVDNKISGYQPKGDYALAAAIPTKVSQLQNDAGYLTEHQDISGKLDAPATAKVGQTIVVKAVDENSKPTEWEAADLLGGGNGEVELIANITLTEEVNVCSVDIPEEKYKSLFVYGYSVGTASSPHDAFTAIVNIHLSDGSIIRVCNVPGYINKGAGGFFFMNSKITEINSVFHGYGGRGGFSEQYPEATWGCTFGSITEEITLKSEINCISLCAANSEENGAFGAGSKIMVWGGKV